MSHIGTMLALLLVHERSEGRPMGRVHRGSAAAGFILVLQLSKKIWCPVFYLGRG